MMLKGDERRLIKDLFSKLLKFDYYHLRRWDCHSIRVLVGASSAITRGVRGLIGASYVTRAGKRGVRTWNLKPPQPRKANQKLQKAAGPSLASWPVIASFLPGIQCSNCVASQPNCPSSHRISVRSPHLTTTRPTRPTHHLNKSKWPTHSSRAFVALLPEDATSLQL